MDFYLQNLEELKGQPKRTIADYVEQNGISVPRRFESLDKAKKSGLDIICRSELSQDYEGFSGLLNSPNLINFTFGEFNEISERNIKDYCDLNKISREYLISQLSYSYWEKLGGFNRSIVADSTIKGRYHMFTTKFPNHNYLIWDNEEIILNTQFELDQELFEGIPNVIEFYETIRNLSNFNSNHCPIIEFQTVNDKNYFLQYHRTRDFVESSFTLDRDSEKDEVEIGYIRGSTQPEGEIFNFQNWPINFSTVDKFDSARTGYGMLSEYMSLNYRLLLAGYTRERLAFHTIDHQGKSPIFKPQIFMSDRDLRFATEGEIIKAVEKNQEEPIIEIPIKLVSDGRKAYVKRM